MRSSRRLEFTEDAESDLRSLLRYTNASWGVEQRDVYGQRILDAIRELLVHPHLGPAREDVAPGLRNRRVGQHIIYYRVYEQSIRIVRILHARMNPEAHLHGRS